MYQIIICTIYNIDKHWNMDKPWKNYTKQKMPDQKRNILSESIYIKYPEQANP